MWLGLKESLRRGPVYTTRRTAYKLYEWQHPDDPWLAQGAIEFLDAELPRDGAGLEWGSGRSTSWFARRLNHLTSVEQDEGWYRKVQRDNPEADLRHIPVEHVHGMAPNFPDPLPLYVAVAREFDDLSLDFVLVDGHYRLACIRTVLPKLKPGSILVVDNTDRLPELSLWGVPTGWPVVHQSRNVMTETTIWQVAPRPVPVSRH
jgi:hypothetical protein